MGRNKTIKSFQNKDNESQMRNTPGIKYKVNSNEKEDTPNAAILRKK